MYQAFAKPHAANIQLASEAWATQWVYAPCAPAPGGPPPAAQQPAAPLAPLAPRWARAGVRVGRPGPLAGVAVVPVLALAGAPEAYTRMEHLWTMGFDVAEGPGTPRGGRDGGTTTVKAGCGGPMSSAWRGHWAPRFDDAALARAH